MQTALRQMVTVQKGGLIQISSPELPDGAQAEVIVLLETQPVDVSDTWSEQDLQDVTRYSLQRAITVPSRAAP